MYNDSFDALHVNMIVRLVSILVLPFRLAFEEDTSKMLGLDIAIDSIFFMDIIVNFLTPYSDEKYN